MSSLSPLPPLPSETVLQILAHLSLPDLASAVRVSSGVWSLAQAHGQGLYHRMAISHGYVDNDQERDLTLEQLSARVGSLHGVTSWTDVCEYPAGTPAGNGPSKLTSVRSGLTGSGYRRRTLNRNWNTARCESDWKWNIQRDVWRIKIDHDQQTIITTGRRGQPTRRPISNRVDSNG